MRFRTDILSCNVAAHRVGGDRNPYQLQRAWQRAQKTGLGESEEEAWSSTVICVGLSTEIPPAAFDLGGHLKSSH